MCCLNSIKHRFQTFFTSIVQIEMIVNSVKYLNIKIMFLMLYLLYSKKNSTLIFGGDVGA